MFRRGESSLSGATLVSVLTARYVGSQLSESLYDTMLRLGRLPALPPTQSTDRQLLQVRRVIEGVSPRTPMVFIEGAGAGAPAKGAFPGRAHYMDGSAGLPHSEPPMPPRELSASSIRSTKADSVEECDGGAL